MTSNDPRLLALMGSRGVVAVGIYFLILTEMQRLKCAALPYGQWSQALRIASVLDQGITGDQITEIIDSLVETKLLGASGTDVNARMLSSPELTEVFEKSARKSEVTRQAAKKRWAA